MMGKRMLIGELCDVRLAFGNHQAPEIEVEPIRGGAQQQQPHLCRPD
jgi:hypothetical protein